MIIGLVVAIIVGSVYYFVKQQQAGVDENGRLDKDRMGGLGRQDKILNKSDR